MGGRLLSRREAIAWIASFLFVASLLVATRFASDDPDSALYAAISARLAASAKHSSKRTGTPS